MPTIEELSKLATVGDVQPDAPLERYLSAASKVCGEGYDRFEQGDMESAFVYLLRFVTLVFEQLQRHPDWRAPRTQEHRNKKRLYSDQAKTAIQLLEEVKRELLSVQHTDDVIRRRAAHVAAQAREEEARRQQAACAAAEAEARRQAAMRPPQLDPSRLLAILGEEGGGSEGGRAWGGEPASLYPNLAGAARQAGAPSYLAFMPAQQQQPQHAPAPFPARAAAAARAGAPPPAEGELLRAHESEQSRDHEHEPSAAEALMAALGGAPEADAHAEGAEGAVGASAPATDASGQPEPSAETVPREGPPDVPGAQSGSSSSGTETLPGSEGAADTAAAAPTPAPGPPPAAPASSAYPNSERPHTSYAVGQVPAGPVSSARAPPADRHAVGAPPPPKLSARPAPTTQDQRLRLRHHLELRGFVEQPVPGDGNCQFHALVDQLAQNGVVGLSARELRSKAVHWLERNADRPMDDGTSGGGTPSLKESIGVGDWPRYLSDMRQHGVTWGDEGTLLAVSVLFRAEIVVISSLSEEYCHIVHPPPSWKVPLRMRLYLGHYHEFHYVSVRFA